MLSDEIETHLFVITTMLLVAVLREWITEE